MFTGYMQSYFSVANKHTTTPFFLHPNSFWSVYWWKHHQTQGHPWSVYVYLPLGGGRGQTAAVQAAGAGAADDAARRALRGALFAGLLLSLAQLLQGKVG